MTDTVVKITYRDGELENLLQVRDKFVDLNEQYAGDTNTLGRSKMPGTVFATVFFIGA